MSSAVITGQRCCHHCGGCSCERVTVLFSAFSRVAPALVSVSPGAVVCMGVAVHNNISGVVTLLVHNSALFCWGFFAVQIGSILLGFVTLEYCYFKSASFYFSTLSSVIVAGTRDR